MLFAGEGNWIYMSREYFQEYSCQFDLRYYPFDTQVLCNYFLKLHAFQKTILKLGIS